MMIHQRTFRYTVRVILLLFISPFISAQTNPAPVSHVETKKYDVAIFSKNSKELFYGNERFTPDISEVEKAEAALLKQLGKLNSDRQNQYATPVIDKHLSNYRRQYFGYIDQKGNKILFINCFWKRKKEEENIWLKEQIRVLDGGSYYWNVKYNLNNDELFDLEVNGDA